MSSQPHRVMSVKMNSSMQREIGRLGERGNERRGGGGLEERGREGEEG